MFIILERSIFGFGLVWHEPLMMYFWFPRVSWSITYIFFSLFSNSPRISFSLSLFLDKFICCCWWWCRSTHLRSGLRFSFECTSSFLLSRRWPLSSGPPYNPPPFIEERSISNYCPSSLFSDGWLFKSWTSPLSICTSLSSRFLFLLWWSSTDFTLLYMAIIMFSMGWCFSFRIWCNSALGTCSSVNILIA